jgi:hypothetical protein
MFQMHRKRRKKGNEETGIITVHSTYGKKKEKNCASLHHPYQDPFYRLWADYLSFLPRHILYRVGAGSSLPPFGSTRLILILPLDTMTPEGEKTSLPCLSPRASYETPSALFSLVVGVFFFPSLFLSLS